MDKFDNKYRIPSARLQMWNYGANGLYFITICTHNREHYFGEIIDGEIVFSEIGRLVNSYWNEIPEHFTFIKLDEFVVMPNHFHGIIINNKSVDGRPNGGCGLHTDFKWQSRFHDHVIRNDESYEKIKNFIIK
ncbi:MAG: transposase [Bacteroidetes bacterium HGW-Bacteroidetes-22]|nr:MAG: transposase [Bacteroidetes bacterium HGW-Bacteroidetes-22]